MLATTTVKWNSEFLPQQHRQEKALGINLTSQGQSWALNTTRKYKKSKNRKPPDKQCHPRDLQMHSDPCQYPRALSANLEKLFPIYMERRKVPENK